MDITSPKHLKQIRSLQGKLNAIRKYIYQLSYAPFSHFLKKETKFVWDEKYK